jgi:hypothetical protein
MHGKVGVKVTRELITSRGTRRTAGSHRSAPGSALHRIHVRPRTFIEFPRSSIGPAAVIHHGRLGCHRSYTDCTKGETMSLCLPCLRLSFLARLCCFETPWFWQLRNANHFRVWVGPRNKAACRPFARPERESCRMRSSALRSWKMAAML